MTRITYEPEMFRVEVSGHAGFDEKGRDVVCAGISILTYTLLNAAASRPEYMAHLYINEGEGMIWMQCYPDEEHEAECREMLRTVLTGYEIAQKVYPDYIEITGGYEEDG